VKTLKTVKRAIAQNYFIRLYYVGVGSADESIERIKNRVRKGGHDIAAEDVKRRYEKRFDDLLKILPYCNEAYFFDNENGFVKKGEFKNGELTLYSGETPAWLQELADFVRVALP
jgi:predicted ABC-type ATPase